VDRDACLIGEVHQVRRPADHRMMHGPVLLRHGHAFYPGGEVVGHLFLEEALSFDAIGVALTATGRPST
jgi:hypothetical protein